MTIRYRTRGQYKVEFPLSNLTDYDVYFMRATIHQRIRRHDVATIRVRTTRLRWFEAFSTGAPVRITYSGQGFEQGEFIGYVTHVKPVVQEEKGYYERDIVCVAASRTLRQTGRKVYRNMTAPEIAMEIGDKLKFTVVSKQHGLRRPIVVHGGETYWEFLARLAKRTGYVLRVDGTTIYFMPLTDMVKSFRTRAVYLTDYGYQSNEGFDAPNVHSIESWVGDSSDDPENLSDITSYTSVSPATGEVHTVQEIPGSAVSLSRTSRSKYIRYPSDLPAHSRADAKLLAKGAADNGLMAFDTRLTVSGNPGLSPYRPVFLDVKDQPLNGYLVVKEVKHVMSKGLYHCDLVVSTDSVDGINRSSALRGARPQRDLAAEAEQGFSPDAVSQSRLKVTGTGPVRGTTGSVGKWVAR